MERLHNLIAKFLHSKERRVLAENFLSLAALQGLNYLLPLIVFPYLVIVLGPSKYGLINFAQSLILYFVLLTDYGFNYSASREISIHRDDLAKVARIYSSVMTIKIGLSVLSFAILSIIVALVPRFRNDSLLYYYTFIMVAGNILVPIWFFQGMERMKYITVLNVVSKIIFTVSIFIFIKRADQYFYVPLLNSLGYLAAGVLSLWILRRDFGIIFFIPEKKDITHQLREGWHVFISTVAISAYSNTRIFAVGLLTNDTLTGLYTIAEKIISFLQAACLIPLVQTVYPRLSKIYSENRSRSFDIMKRLQKYATIAYCVIVPVLFVIAPAIVNIIARAPYAETIVSLRLLLVATFFTSANAFRVQFLLVSGLKNVFANIHLVAGAVGIISVFLLTALFSYLGPSLGLLIVEPLVMFMTIKSLNARREATECAGA